MGMLYWRTSITGIYVLWEDMSYNMTCLTGEHVQNRTCQDKFCERTCLTGGYVI